MKNKFSVKANKKNRTFTIRINGNKYRTCRMNRIEFEQNLNNTPKDWENWLKTENFYYIVK